MSSVYESHRERIAARVIALSRRVPFGALLVWQLLGADIPASVSLGRDVRFPHGAHGVVIHPLSVVGDRAVIYHNVTLASNDEQTAAPVLEGDVMVGAGAVVLGGVRLGAGCKVGANAVVTKDVAAKATVVGVPAKALYSVENGSLL